MKYSSKIRIKTRGNYFNTEIVSLYIVFTNFAHSVVSFRYEIYWSQITHARKNSSSSFGEDF